MFKDAVGEVCKATGCCSTPTATGCCSPSAVTGCCAPSPTVGVLVSTPRTSVSAEGTAVSCCRSTPAVHRVSGKSGGGVGLIPLVS